MRGLSHHVGMKLGSVIKMLRAQHKLSQRALAARIGVTGGAVAQWEKDETTPTVGNLEAMSRILGFALKGPLMPGRPYSGEFVDDPDELALVHFWRGLKDSQRAVMLGVLKTIALADKGD
jgi:transcriptional regulator with XRE-family HTH domain